ncbi:ATP-binding protein [Sphingomonas astaxanthinifaciens]|uniref:histidine kinase n=1 Tax=Sphingomonas astaxanthinifaciens DSM 22298 TaxID=1123267 RepID=A0ABQ5Z3X3_9SPHN|nr:ATP-binding protein [Sphingomonas astaxanthinifaciens]GLR46695.1 hypothetical protein GCM10007925_04060 [Sphingomonas astaxanthinifaciens DSM 22298]
MFRALRAAATTGLPLLLASVLTLALALSGILLTAEGGRIAMLWLANAALIALLLMRPRREWAGLMTAGGLGYVAANLLSGDGLPLAIGLAGCNLVEIAIVAWSFVHWHREPVPIVSVAQLETLALLAISAPLVSTALAGLVLALAGAGASIAALSHWYVADMLGIMMLLPVALSVVARQSLPGPVSARGRAGRIEFALLLALIAVTGAWVFTANAELLFLTTPGLVLAGLRLRLHQATLAVALACAIAGAATLLGHGPLSALSVSESSRMFLLQAYMATAVILVLPIATLNEQRGRTAATLRQREEHYRLLADQSSDLILRLDASGHALFVSGASRRLLGLEEQALRGPLLLERLFPDDRQRLLAAIGRTVRYGHAVACVRLRNARGGYRWMEAHTRSGSLHHEEKAEAPLPTGEPGVLSRDEPAIIVATLRDIHERHNAERQATASAARIREANHLLRMAEELASLGHWVFDADRRELLFSEEAATLLGFAQLTADPAEALAQVAQTDRRLLLRALAKARRRLTPIECVVRMRSEGAPRTFQLRIQRKDEDGDGSGLFGVVSEITDKLRAEQQLVAALHEARSAAAFRSQFLATMSHEIRTPMTGVLGMIELLAGDPTPSERDLYLETLHQSADLMMAVLNDILDFSKVDAGRLTIAEEPFEIGATLLTTMRLFDHTASTRGLSLHFEGLPTEELWLRGDALRLRQVLSNLLSNAIKFSSEGTIRLRCAIEERGPAKRALRLSVSDQGIGIPPDLLERLFEPFVQGETPAAETGTGLGLAISGRLVAAMGGTITIESREGQGSTFTVAVTLPLAAPSLPAQTQETRDSARSLDILLAEDNPVNQLLVTALCKRLGHRLTAAGDGEMAVATAATRCFDLILMDMQMPRCDGLTAAERIRQGGGPSAQTPIIALTADAGAVSRPNFAHAGIDSVLTKPVDSRLLGATLADVASGRVRRGVPPRKLSVPTSLDGRALEEMRTLLGDARLDELLSLLAGELEQRPRMVREALADRDFERAAAEAHSLKGAAANLGAGQVAEAARLLEIAIAAAASGEARGVTPALRRLAGAVSKTQQALAAVPRSANVLAVEA